MHKHDIIQSFFETAKYRGLSRANARHMLARELKNPGLANYSRIWDMTPRPGKQARQNLPPDINRFMLRYSISYVTSKHDPLTWADRLSPP